MPGARPSGSSSSSSSRPKKTAAAAAAKKTAKQQPPPPAGVDGALHNVTEEDVREAARRRILLQQNVYQRQKETINASKVEIAALEELSTHIQPQHYKDIVEERAILRKCGYPLCDATLSKQRPKPGVLFHLSKSDGAVYQAEDVARFCGRPCWLASTYFERQINDEPIHLRHNVVKATVLPVELGWEREKKKPENAPEKKSHAAQLIVDHLDLLMMAPAGPVKNPIRLAELSTSIIEKEFATDQQNVIPIISDMRISETKDEEKKHQYPPNIVNDNSAIVKTTEATCTISEAMSLNEKAQEMAETDLQQDSLDSTVSVSSSIAGLVSHESKNAVQKPCLKSQKNKVDSNGSTVRFDDKQSSEYEKEEEEEKESNNAAAIDYSDILSFRSKAKKSNIRPFLSTFGKLWSILQRIITDEAKAWLKAEQNMHTSTSLMPEKSSTKIEAESEETVAWSIPVQKKSARAQRREIFSVHLLKSLPDTCKKLRLDDTVDRRAMERELLELISLLDISSPQYAAAVIGTLGDGSAVRLEEGFMLTLDEKQLLLTVMIKSLSTRLESLGRHLSADSIVALMNSHVVRCGLLGMDQFSLLMEIFQ